MAQLKPGTEAFVIVQQAVGKSGERHKLQGAARVEIESYRNPVYTVRVLAGSGVPVELLLQFERKELYVTPDEHKYFGELVRWLWCGVLITRTRPEVK